MAAEPDDTKGSSAGRRPTRPQAVAENAISASRRSRKPAQKPRSPAPASADPASPEIPQGPSFSPGKRTETDPWTVPQSVRDRFIQEGNRFYFADGVEAFKDRGRRLTTQSENTQVVASLIEIARSRAWSEITVTGTEPFRREAWQQARVAGLNVRGYRPSEEERAQLIRRIARSRDAPTEPVESVIPVPPVGATARTPENQRAERIQGKLLEHGKDFYRHDPNEAPSYFVLLETPEGKREVWGKDIERALVKSLSQAKVGDEIVLQRTGRDAVTVQRTAKDAEGELREQPVDKFRNRWVLEKREFFAQRSAAAAVVRDGSIGPQEAVREHPELTGTYLTLRAAQLAARSLRDTEDQRRFIQQVRFALAGDIERGEPLQAVRLRDRRAREQTPRKQREGPSLER